MSEKKRINRVQSAPMVREPWMVVADPEPTIDELRGKAIDVNRPDALANATLPEDGPVFGYAGKILYVNLTDGSTNTIPSSTYLPKWMGGSTLGYKIFYDDVPAGVKAFDPENEIIYASGPATATGLPCSARSEFVTIDPNSIPEQIAWSGIGGYMSVQMKFAGYDAVVIRGKADRPTVLFIDDDKVNFVDATECWGKLIHPSLDWIQEKLGADVQCCAIGPAGEKLVRFATVTTRTDSTAAKGGLGAVFGSKNLKGLAFRGTGSVTPANLEKVLELRKKVAYPRFRPNPVMHTAGPNVVASAGDFEIKVDGGIDNGRLACSYGCTMRCNKVMLNSVSVFTGNRIAQMDKCVSMFSWNQANDQNSNMDAYFTPEINHHISHFMSYDDLGGLDPTAEHFAGVFGFDPEDTYGWPIVGWNKARIVDQYCQEYGVDKWDTLVFYFTWLSMCHKEGLLDDLDFGIEIDFESDEFIEHCMKILVNREGIGNLFAEGMGRAIRQLGEEKYGHSIYHGRHSQVLGGKRLDIPVSLEIAWGTSSHWGGRGFQGQRKSIWVQHALKWMTSTRDTISNGHAHDKYENAIRYMDNPSESMLMLKNIIHTQRGSVLKDALPCCEWASPNVFWPEMEAEMFEAVTGIPCTYADLCTLADRSDLIFRAILMRNSGRDRDMEVNEVFPYFTFPDPHGEIFTWDEWNDVVDRYYQARGWDFQTGWPIREAWVAAGMADVADDMQALGKLPATEGCMTYERHENTTWRQNIQRGDGVYDD